MSDPRWLAEARKNIGLREIPGGKHNPTILKWWSLIRAPFTDDETPWCAGFVGAMLESSGIESSRSAAARSYLNWGRKLSNPRLGCITVFERGPRNGHVGFMVGKDARGNLLILGGNQGDAVNIKPFSASRVLGYRWPDGEPLPSANIPSVDSNEEVSRRESFMSQPDDPGADEPSGGAIDKIKHWMNGVGTTAVAMLSSLFDVRIAAVVVAAGLIVFLVIWFFPRKR
jgi:uncharacterized protein (TIGR02594 family)